MNVGPTIPEESGMVVVQASPFEVSVGTAYRIASRSESLFPMDLSCHDVDNETTLALELTDATMYSIPYHRNCSNEYAIPNIMCSGTLSVGAATGPFEGMCHFQHGWETNLSQPGFASTMVRRSFDVFPQHLTPSRPISDQWIRFYISNTVNQEVVEGYVTSVSSSVNVYPMYYQHVIHRESEHPMYQKGRCMVTTWVKSPKTDTLYPTELHFTGQAHEFNLYLTTENLYWFNLIHMDQDTQNARQLCPVLDAFEAHCHVYGELSGQSSFSSEDAWIQVSSLQHQDHRHLQVMSLLDLPLDKVGDFRWPRTSANQATSVFFLWMIPVLVGATIFALVLVAIHYRHKQPIHEE